MIEPGRVFIGLDPRGHLWFAISRQSVDGAIVMANITTHWPDDPDHKACRIVGEREHDWVQHDSCLYPKGVAFFSAAKIEQDIRAGAVERRGPASRALLRRLQLATLESPYPDASCKTAIRAAVRQA